MESRSLKIYKIEDICPHTNQPTGAMAFLPAQNRKDPQIGYLTRSEQEDLGLDCCCPKRISFYGWCRFEWNQTPTGQFHLTQYGEPVEAHCQPTLYAMARSVLQPSGALGVA